MVPPDLLSDPFRERQRRLVRKPMALLGTRIRFESNDRRLLKLADEAFAGLPPHQLRQGAASSRARSVGGSMWTEQSARDLRIALQLVPAPRARNGRG